MSRRTRIVSQVAVGIGGRVPHPDRAPARPRVRRLRLAEKPANAVAPFAGSLRLVGSKIVEPSAGMRVDDAKRLVLQLQIFDQPASARRA